MDDNKPNPFDSKYDPKYCAMFVQMMSEGKFVCSFAAKVGVCKQTVYNWVKDHEEFARAFNHGRACAEAYWAEQMLHNLHYDIKTPFNTMGWSKVMGACFKWSDKVEEKVEQTTEIKLSYKLDDEKLDTEPK